MPKKQECGKAERIIDICVLRRGVKKVLSFDSDFRLDRLNIFFGIYQF